MSKLPKGGTRPARSKKTAILRRYARVLVGIDKSIRHTMAVRKKVSADIKVIKRASAA